LLLQLLGDKTFP